MNTTKNNLQPQKTFRSIRNTTLINNKQDDKQKRLSRIGTSFISMLAIAITLLAVLFVLLTLLSLPAVPKAQLEPTRSYAAVDAIVLSIFAIIISTFALARRHSLK